ncbi:MAG: coenzyme F420-0:L-glutamate ligase [Actinobacteria bacterium]|nr:coenzyme F420-0:L-glutamate ligase [Actinomycetota bacterium]
MRQLRRRVRHRAPLHPQPAHRGRLDDRRHGRDPGRLEPHHAGLRRRRAGDRHRGPLPARHRPRIRRQQQRLGARQRPGGPREHPALSRLQRRRALVRVVRRRGDLIITETKHGFICANSGVDLSNVERGYAALLPLDSDRSARRIRDIIKAKLGVTVGVIVSDTFGRPWRKGLTDVAIGVAGIAAVHDLRGTPDALGRVMQVTEVSIADEVASAAELVMGKSSGIPVAIVRGLDKEWFRESSMDEIVRPAQEDLFR